MRHYNRKAQTYLLLFPKLYANKHKIMTKGVSSMMFSKGTVCIVTFFNKYVFIVFILKF